MFAPSASADGRRRRDSPRTPACRGRGTSRRSSPPSPAPRASPGRAGRPSGAPGTPRTTCSLPCARRARGGQEITNGGRGRPGGAALLLAKLVLFLAEVRWQKRCVMAQQCCVIQVGYIGDLVLSTGLFRVLSTRYDVDAVVLAMSAPVLKHCPYIRHVYCLPQRRNSVTVSPRWKAYSPFLGMRYDLVISASGTHFCDSVSFSVPTDHVAGFAGDEYKCKDDPPFDTLMHA